MEERVNILNTYLLVPVALVTLATGLISVFQETKWYVYTPLFIITALSVIWAYFNQMGNHEFEVIWQEIIIDILDNQGNEALLTNTSNLKALKNGSSQFTYQLYSDGKIENIETKEGSVSEVRKESGRFIVNTNIEFPVEKGTEIIHTLTAKYVESFIKEREYLQAAKDSPGTKIKLTILTPGQRPIKECKAYKIVGQTKTLLKQQPQRVLLGNKQGITLNYDKAKFLEKYRLEWNW